MITIFDFMRLWDELTVEEKAYLEDHHSLWNRDENQALTDIEKSLLKKGILQNEEYYYDGTVHLSISKWCEWIFEGLTINAGFK